MKKAVAILSLVVFTAILFTSCRSTSKCAAYGEVHKFQREVKY